jgi:hypothetical protein
MVEDEHTPVSYTTPDAVATKHRCRPVTQHGDPGVAVF